MRRSSAVSRWGDLGQPFAWAYGIAPSFAEALAMVL